jgi:hypothetical protein
MVARGSMPGGDLDVAQVHACMVVTPLLDLTWRIAQYG